MKLYAALSNLLISLIIVKYLEIKKNQKSKSTKKKKQTINNINNRHKQ
jgi:hypothetical protein